ncbi:MAG: EAL domain-containing protein, partial [Oscillospiraceae bacterium]|nr:EAL domain-containing protein [Oscillospiraceae bacterium]
MENATLASTASELTEIRNVLEPESLVAYFQQIVSVSRKMVIGVEGLIRGIDAQSGEIISARELFGEDERGISLELDRKCRTEILYAFSKIYPFDKEKLLFLNIDAAILEHSIGSGYLMEQVNQYGI